MPAVAGTVEIDKTCKTCEGSSDVTQQQICECFVATHQVEAQSGNTRLPGSAVTICSNSCNFSVFCTAHSHLAVLICRVIDSYCSNCCLGLPRETGMKLTGITATGCPTTLHIESSFVGGPMKASMPSPAQNACTCWMSTVRALLACTQSRCL